MTRKPVGRNDIPQLFRTTALNRVEPLLNRLNPEGYFGPGGPKALSHERQFIYPLAYFYKTPFPGNPYGGERRILDAAVSIGTHVARCTLKSGEMEYESRGYHGRVVDQRFLYFWIKAYALLKRDLPLSIGKRWESAMNRSLRHLNRRLTGYLEQERFNWKSFGTGPNHAILYATALYQGGLHFKNKAWKANALEFAERFAKFQDPEGYYPEGGGPVCVYSLLSHTGVARFALWTGKKPFVDACHRAFAYEQKICYPDFSYVGLIDKRQHYSPIPAIWGLFGYSFTPEGRAFAARKMAARLKRRPDLGGEDSALCLENFESWQHGPCARIRSWRGETFLGNRICFVREKGWQYDFCVNAAIVNPRSAFRLADEKVYSVWHRSLGALVLGTQDKHQPRHNTFWAKSGEELGVFLGGRIGNKARPRYVEAVYSNGLTGRISIRARSANRLELSAENRGARIRDLRFNVPLNARIGSTVTVGHRSFTLTEKDVEIPVHKDQVVALLDGRVKIRSANGGRLCFPCSPFNPYSADHKSHVGAAFLRFEVPVNGVKRPARIRVIVA